MLPRTSMALADLIWSAQPHHYDLFHHISMLRDLRPIFSPLVNVNTYNRLASVYQINSNMAQAQSTILSSLDQLMPRSYVLIALVFSGHDQDNAIVSLQDGLEKTIEQLPFLKGKVHERAEERKQLAISWDMTSPIPKLQRKPPPEAYPSFEALRSKGAPSEYFPYSVFPGLPPNAHLKEDGAPVFGATYVTIEGGFILSIAVHHNVMDGTGVGEFLRLWAQNVRGVEASDSQSVPNPEEPLKRQVRLLDAFKTDDKNKHERNPILQTLLERHPEFDIKAPFESSAVTTANAPSPPIGMSKVFAFSGRKLTALKISLAGIVPPTTLTINNILSAIIWSHISHVRASRASQPVGALVSKLGFAVNGRRLLGFIKPPYLGNVNLYARAQASFTELGTPSTNNHANLAPVITSIAEATARINTIHIEDLNQLVDSLSDVSELIPGWKFSNGPDVALTSWANLGLYDMDFGDGIGKPDIVRIPGVPFDGLVVILPRRRKTFSKVDEDEIIEVTVMLREDDMENLNQNAAWRSWLLG